MNNVALKLRRLRLWFIAVFLLSTLSVAAFLWTGETHPSVYVLFANGMIAAFALLANRQGGS